MEYEPKILVNKTDKPVEFFCGGKLYMFKPGEQRPIDGFAAYHALKMTNTGLIEVGTSPETKVSEQLELDKMSWKDLRSMTDKQGKKIYVMGMNRNELIKEIQKCLA